MRRLVLTLYRYLRQYLDRQFNRLHRQLGHVMATIQELNDKLDSLQSDLDAEQAQIQAALDAQAALIAELQAQVAAGSAATPEQLQSVIDRITAISSDLKSTIPDAPTP